MTTKTRPVYIVGAGAIGQTVAAMLSRNGRKVTLIRGSADGLSEETRQITVDAGKKGLYTEVIEVKPLSSFERISGTLVVAIKSFGNEKLAQKLKHISGDSPIVLLQNGLGVERAFMSQGFPHIYRCVLYTTCQPLESGVIHFRQVKASPIGIERGNLDDLTRIAAALDTPEMGFCIVPDIQTEIWKKAVINSVFNSICPLLEADNGIFHRNGMATDIAERVIVECTSLAQAYGISLDDKELMETLLEISKVSEGQEISTLQDLKAGRQTEIDTLNPEISRIAQRLGLEPLVTESRLLGQLILLKSTIHRNSIQL